MATLTGMDGTVRYRGTQYKSRAELVNGRNRPREYDGSTWTLLGIEPARFTPSVATGGAGVLIGRYRYAVQPVNTLHTTPMGRSLAGNPSYFSKEYNANSEKITVANIPATHPDPQVNKWAIYRSRASGYSGNAPVDGTDMFFVAFVAIGTTTYTDNLPDNQLPAFDTLRFNQNIPPGLKSINVYGERAFLFGHDYINTGTVTKATVNISSATYSNNLLSFVTASAHGLSVWQYVLVNSGSPEYDGPLQVLSVADATHFTAAPLIWNDGQTANVASIGAQGTIEVVNCSSNTWADGVIGLWFNSTDGQDYRIVYRNSSTQIVLDRPYSAALSAAAYQIYWKQWEIGFSDFEDVAAYGPDGFSSRYTREVPGRQPALCGLNWDGEQLVFTPEDIYAIRGKDPAVENVVITPEPRFKGLGAVGPDAVDHVEAEVYFLSRRGPAMLRGGTVQLIGQTLLTDWLDSLTLSDLSIATVGCEGRYVYFDVVAATGDTENSVTYRYDRYELEWHKERYKHCAFYFHDDGDNGFPGLFYVQGACIFQPNKDTYDGTTALYSGTVTSGTTTTITNSGAAFPTASGGIVESYVHLFNAAGVYQASRRITGNTATQVTWSATGAGGGTVTTPAAGWTYKIGNVWWYWYTRKWQSPAVMKRDLTAYVLFDNYTLPAEGTIPNVTVTDYRDGQSGTAMKLKLNVPEKPYEINCRNFDLQLKIESDDGAVVRGVIGDAVVEDGVK